MSFQGGGERENRSPVKISNQMGFDFSVAILAAGRQWGNAFNSPEEYDVKARTLYPAKS